MKSILGIIAPSYDDTNFGGLTKARSAPMLPFGCRYRLIDFALSNMTNYGIRTVGVYPEVKIRSYMDHLGMGAPWNLNRRFQGLFLFPPTVSQDKINKFGELVEFYSTLDFYENVREDYIYYTQAEVLMKLNIDDLYKQCLESDCDVMFIYAPIKDESLSFLDKKQVILDENGNLKNISYYFGSSPEFNLYLGSFLIKKEVFYSLIRRGLELGEVSTMEDIILHYCDRLNIGVYCYDGVFELIDSAKRLYDANMRLLDEEYFDQIFNHGGKIYTKTKDEPATYYSPESKVKDSLFANGCMISGEVENSIIFRGVTIEPGAIVRNSIVMQKTTIKKDAVVINSILDKNVFVGVGQRLIGNQAQPYVIDKNRVVE